MDIGKSLLLYISHNFLLISPDLPSISLSSDCDSVIMHYFLEVSFDHCWRIVYVYIHVGLALCWSAACFERDS